MVDAGHLGYIKNHWRALNRYLEDGLLNIDNNRAEYQLRAVAVGRKNWLFAGSFEGARRAATLYSLVQSFDLPRLTPYSTSAMSSSASPPTHHHCQIGELTPRMWVKALEKQSAA